VHLGSLLFLVGSLAWVVAVVAAAQAYRQAGAPLIVSILLAFSVVAVFHAPPIGPIGLLRWRSIRCVRDGHRNGAGAVGVHHVL
jgi:hypothetical protein